MNLEFSEATIENITPETPYSRHMDFSVPASILNSYRTPGQYAAIRVPGQKDGFFAMSNAPGEGHWTFLIKESSPLSMHLASLKPGDRIQISAAQGKGFRFDDLQGKNLLLFAVGSGIAPVRASLREIMKERGHYGTVILYYGARNPDEFAYASEFPEWKTSRIDTFLTVSNRQAAAWNELTGYVQHHIPHDASINNTVALVCGMKSMVEGVKEKLMALGLSAEHVRLNF